MRCFVEEGEALMHVRSRLVLALGLALVPASADADKLSKEDKAWMDSVYSLMLQDEEKRFKDLKDKNDRAEFQKIFWARRDPDLETPANEYETEYRTAAAEADKRYMVRGRKGSMTDCGRSYILLGEPTSVKKEGEPEPGGRAPETWTYKGTQFQGGQAVIAFDAACMGQANLRQQFDRIAETRIVQPNIDYRTGSDGRMVKLADQLPKPTPIQALLKAPRQDFPLGAETSFLKVEGGGTAVMGLVRGDGAQLATAEQGGKKMGRVNVGAQVLTGEGKLAAFDEREETVEVGADGGFLASYRLILKPGKYTLKSGVLDPKSSKGSVAETSLEVPDFNSGELTATMILLRSFEELPSGAVDNNHALSGFSLPLGRMLPVFGATLTKADEFQIFFQYYDAKVDEATQKANVIVSVSMLKGVRPVANAPDQTLDRVVAGSSFGPIPLANYGPGTYTVRLRLNDTVAKKELVKEVSFELK
jgi:GWxTD domain-containing protein